MTTQFPSIENGPPKGTWAPAKPGCGLSLTHNDFFKFSVITEDGTAHRFLLTRQSAQWLANTFNAALSIDGKSLPGELVSLMIATRHPMPNPSTEFEIVDLDPCE